MLHIKSIRACGAFVEHVIPKDFASKIRKCNEQLRQDLMRVLVNEKLPGKDQESGEDLSTRHWLQPRFYFFCLLSFSDLLVPPLLEGALLFAKSV